MANIRDLKKDINFVLGDIIEAVYEWEKVTDNKDSKAGTAIIDKSIQVFDTLMEKIHAKDVDNKKKHFAAIRSSLEEKATKLIEDLNQLN